MWAVTHPDVGRMEKREERVQKTFQPPLEHMTKITCSEAMTNNRGT